MFWTAKSSVPVVKWKIPVDLGRSWLNEIEPRPNSSTIKNIVSEKCWKITYRTVLFESGHDHLIISEYRFRRDHTTLLKHNTVSTRNIFSKYEQSIFIFGVGENLGYSFDVELSDLSIYQVFDAQLWKLKKLERVEVVGTEKNRLPLPFRKQFAMWTVLNSFQLTGSSKRSPQLLPRYWIKSSIMSYQ